MDARRWAQIERLYHAALEREPKERNGFLMEMCQGDDELRHELELLLAQDLAGTGLLDHPKRIGATDLWEETGLLRQERGTQPNRHWDLDSSGSTSTLDEGRFVPGTLLAKRYRIISLLGRGGMGEVYRANDLVLGQTVALKFLPVAASADEAALSRFRNEVRMARQVSHPAVCRMHDIGEAEGLTYLTMEFVDGEDLAALLRRIGRLPRDKVLEIAWELCAGLAAAHDKGIVHRDLKPANIMLDARGHVRITDFGLAGLAEQVRDVCSGTPGYMAPEQRAGKEVTQRSDIYALGVVLHELFTGTRPRAGTTQAELDPATERVIQRCLEEDSRKRPPTALAVAAALPGCNPLTAALAAGETPSPEAVARAGAVEGLSPPLAAVLLGAVVVGLLGLFLLRQKADLINQTPMENPPPVLAAKAREIAKALSYITRPGDQAFGWEYDGNYLHYARKQNNPTAQMALLRINQPPAIHFWYRESPDRMIPVGGSSITPTDPPLQSSGMINMQLDSDGNLIQFDARPPAQARDMDRIEPENWNRLLVSAGLDPTHLTAVRPQLIPPVVFDSQAAWIFTTSQGQFRLEAAAYQSQLVFFRRAASWIPTAVGPRRSRVQFLDFFVPLLILASLLAWRNVRSGKGDQKGAFRLACFAFVCTLIEHLSEAHHMPALAEADLLYRALRESLANAALFWALYLAFEPYARRRWPVALVSWSRLLGGELKDPLLGGDVLRGTVLGIAGNLILAGAMLDAPFSSYFPSLAASAGSVFSLWSYLLLSGVASGLSFMFFLILLRRLVRPAWLAGLIFIVLVSLLYAPSSGPGFAIIVSARALLIVMAFYCLTTFGVLCTVTWFCILLLLIVFPITTNTSAWYFQDALLTALAILALAFYAFRTTLAGRPLWHEQVDAG